MKGLSITSRARERLVVAHQALDSSDSPRLPRTRLSASSGKPIDRNSDAGGGNGKRGGPLSRWSLLPQSACARWAVALAGAALLVAALLLLLRADRIFTDVGGGTTEACCYWDRCSGQLCSTAAAVALRRRKRRCAHVGQLSFAAAQKKTHLSLLLRTREATKPPSTLTGRRAARRGAARRARGVLGGPAAADCMGRGDIGIPGVAQRAAAAAATAGSGDEHF